MTGGPRAIGCAAPATGLLVVDKPEGLTSQAAVTRVRLALGRPRAGHLGTLDPFATGVLPVLVGTATRLAPWYGATVKSYEATLALGSETDTMDREGRVVREAPFHHVTPEDVARAVEGLRGPRDQVAPMFSARKVGGRRLHVLARQGKTVERPPRHVVVHEARVVQLDLAAGRVAFAVRVSAGTYVRVLGEDLARACGTAGHLVALRRLAVGTLGIEGSLALDAPDLAARARAALVPPGSLLTEVPAIRVGAEGAERVRHGMEVDGQGIAVDPGASVRVLDEAGDLLAMGEMDGGGHVRPRVVLSGY